MEETNDILLDTFKKLSEVYPVVEVDEYSVSVCDGNCVRCYDFHCEKRTKDFEGYVKVFKSTLDRLQEMINRYEENPDKEVFFDIKYDVATLQECIKYMR